MQRSRGRKEQVTLEKLNQAAMLEAWCPVRLGRPPTAGWVSLKAVSEVKRFSLRGREPQKVHSTRRM